MQAILEEFGLQFDFPENWSLEASNAEGSLPQLTVSSPHTAFLQVSKHSRELTLEDIFDEVLAALRSEYGKIEADLCTEHWGEMQPEGYSVNFFCHGLTNTCWVFGFPSQDGNYLTICQAEDREFDRVSDVFRSMLSGIQKSAAGAA